MPLTPALVSMQSQRLQTILLYCLAARALSSTSYADTLEAAFASPTGVPRAPSAELASKLQLVFGLVVPGLALVWAFVGEKAQLASRTCARTCFKLRGRDQASRRPPLQFE